MNNIEIWKDIAGTNGYYQISNIGNVRSCYKKRHWVLLKKTTNTQGYYRFAISYPSKKRLFVHREVAKAFIPNPNKLPVVNHLDCNPLNCNADNLEWTTLKGNYSHSKKLGHYDRTSKWIKNLTDTQRKINGKPICGTSLDGKKHIYLDSLNQCKMYGFQPSCVSNCCTGKRKYTAGYTWKFVTPDEIARLKGLENAE